MLKPFGYDRFVVHKEPDAALVNDLRKAWDNMLGDANFRSDGAARKWLESWLFQHVRSEDLKCARWITGLSQAEHAEQAIASKNG